MESYTIFYLLIFFNQIFYFIFFQMLEDKGNTAVYLLYALTRIKSIARNAGVTSEQLKEASETTPISLEHPKEWKLGKVCKKLIHLKASQGSAFFDE